MSKVIFGDCLLLLRAMAAAGEKVQMCVTSPPYFGLRSYLPDGHADKPLEIGLEETPDLYIARMVEVFRAVRDVLADDGTLWLNIGDSYAANRGYQVNQTKGGPKHGPAQAVDGRGQKASDYGLKPKDLIGIPWMLAFALRADGWYLRQDIIWNKPNPMPESVTDRCTKSHEYVFLLSKSATYFYDHEAIKEPAAIASIERWQQDVENQTGSDRVPGKTNGNMKAVGGRLAGNVNPPKGQLAYEAGDKKHRTKAGLLNYAQRSRSKHLDPADYDNAVRNKRSVWTVATAPYSGAHFATFPPALIEPCIMAGSRAGDTVLDPFFGSGTTGQVAQHLGRYYIGCELNRDYEKLQLERTRQFSLLTG